MSTVSIPDWTADGSLPPIDVLDPISAERSPYRVSLTDFVLRFATSSERGRLIDGLLKYRASLYMAGLASGFQWLDGSFAEDVEAMQNRAPNDVDVVTFFRLTENLTQQQALQSNVDLFDHEKVKQTYHVDGYLVDLGLPSEQLVARSHYWYGVWSHRRGDLVWKGYIEIDLAPTDDQAASDLLKTCPGMGGSP